MLKSQEIQIAQSKRREKMASIQKADTLSEDGRTELRSLASSIRPELRRKLGIERLSIDGLMSADVAGRARAVSSLVQSDVPLADAMALVGWSGLELPGVKASPAAVKEAEEN